MNKKILVVDDENDILDAIQIILERENFIVASVSKGEEIYREVDDFMPDLILLDVLISGNDGRTVSQKLKTDDKTKEIPIIMMSAHPSVVKNYSTFGANDFLAKPFEIEDLLKIIRKNLK